MRIPALALFALPLLGCAPTAHDRLGDLAHYAPAFAGYVAGSGAELVILRDPITSEKIRCREDLERVARAVAAAAEDGLHDRHARRVADATFAPLTLFNRAAMMVGTGALFPAAAIVDVSVSANRRDLYLGARELFIAGRVDAAREQFLGVILAQDSVITPLPQPWIERSIYYLGVCDDALHRTREAGEELSRFLLTASTPDEERYLDAERRLARLDPAAVPACHSQAPFEMAWRRSP